MREISDIRNVALIGHSGEGKTSVAEAMLYSGGVTDGNTVMDYDPEEVNRKISISLAVAGFEWANKKVNIIDVPGFFDFEGELIQAMSAADGAIIIMSADGTISVGTEKALDFCLEKGISTMIFINQMDKDQADYLSTVNALKEKYTNKIAPIQIPVMREGKMQGYVSLLSGKAYEFATTNRQEVPMPENYVAQYDELMEKLIDVAASNDDELMVKYFDGETITQDEIVRGVRNGIAAGDAIPVLAGSALQNKGIINLMNQITRVMPSPADKKYSITMDNGDTDELVSCSSGGTICKVFKTVSDPFVGKLSLFKVLRGSVKSGVTLYNVNADKQEKISSIHILKGKKQESVSALGCGDIGAFAKLQHTKTGDTLTDGSKIKLSGFVFPEPVYSMSITSAKQGEEEKVFVGLNRIMEEDKTLSVNRNSDTSEAIISGLGETQLDVVVRKLKNKYSVEAKLAEPKIPYRETIKKMAIGEGKHKKQSGGHGQYGHCIIRFEPEYESAFVFGDEVVGGSVPKQYIPAVEKGLQESIRRGVLAGYPVVNLKATLLDGSYHDVDSSEMAFKLAASLAFRKGCAQANPVILEPIFSYRIVVPEAYLGDIMGDINRRRGRILGVDLDGNKQIINAESPAAEMFKYATDLRSMTQGRGSYTAKLARYEEVPANMTAGIVAASPFIKSNTDD